VSLQTATVTLNTLVLYIITVYYFDTITIGSGVAQLVQCLTIDWTTVIRSPTEAKDFSSSLCVQTSSEAHPMSYPMSTVGPFLGGKSRPRRDAEKSTPSTVEVKKENYMSSPPWRLHDDSGTTLLFLLYSSP
jgi:hypothetical protein